MPKKIEPPPDSWLLDLAGVPCYFRASARARRSFLVYHALGYCELVVPKRRPPSRAAMLTWAARQKAWVERAKKRRARLGPLIRLSAAPEPLSELIIASRLAVAPWLAKYAAHFPAPKSVLFKNFRRRFGTCYRDGRIAFHSRLCLLPPSLIHYVVLHEPCHRRHFNHSACFWRELAQYCPDYAAARRALKAYVL